MHSAEGRAEPSPSVSSPLLPGPPTPPALDPHDARMTRRCSQSLRSANGFESRAPCAGARPAAERFEPVRPTPPSRRRLVNDFWTYDFAAQKTGDDGDAASCDRPTRSVGPKTRRRPQTCARPQKLEGKIYPTDVSYTREWSPGSTPIRHQRVFSRLQVRPPATSALGRERWGERFSAGAREHLTRSAPRRRGDGPDHRSGSAHGQFNTPGAPPCVHEAAGSAKGTASPDRRGGLPASPDTQLNDWVTSNGANARRPVHVSRYLSQTRWRRHHTRFMQRGTTRRGVRAVRQRRTARGEEQAHSSPRTRSSA